MKVTCEHCQEEFESKKEHQDHVKTCEDALKCRLCSKTFKTRENLNMHHLRTHKLPTYECDECEKKFATIGLLNGHRKQAHNGKTYECNQCNKKFATRPMLNRHLLSHGNIIHACVQCKKKYKNLTLLKQHRKLAHGPKKHACDRCEMKYSTIGLLQRHHRRAHGHRNLECDHCGRKFSTRGTLIGHLKYSHGPRMICDKCGENFSTRASLIGHLFSHLPDDGAHLCICLKRFTVYDVYRYHYNRCTNRRIRHCGTKGCHNFFVGNSVKAHRQRFVHPLHGTKHFVHPTQEDFFSPTDEALEEEKELFQRTGSFTVGLHECLRIIAGDPDYVRYRCDNMEKFFDQIMKIEAMKQYLIDVRYYPGKADLDNFLKFFLDFIFPETVQHLVKSKYFMEVLFPIVMDFLERSSNKIVKIGLTGRYPKRQETLKCK